MVRINVPLCAGVMFALVAAGVRASGQDGRANEPHTDAQTEVAPPTFDEVAVRAIKAVGGQAAIDRLQSVYLKAAMLSTVPRGTRELYWSREGGLYVTINTQGVVLEQGIVGSVGWMRGPDGRAILLAQSDLEEFRRETATHLLILGFERFGEYGYKRLDDGNGVAGEIDGEATYRLVYGDEKSGFTTVHYDAESGLPKVVEQLRMRDLVTFTTTLEDWHEVEGVKFFKTATVTAKPPAGEAPPATKLTFEAIEVNGVDPSRFVIPDDVKVLAAEREARQASMSDGEIALEDLPLKSQKEAPMIIEMVRSEGPDSVKEFIAQFGTFSEEMPEGPQKDTFRYIIQELRKEGGGG